MSAAPPGVQSAASADPAAELLKDMRALNANKGTTHVTPMDHLNVRGLATSISDSFRAMESMGQNPFVDPTDPYYRSALQYYRSKSLRGKRCLVGYLQWRLDRATDAWWASQDNLVMPQLEHGEQQYIKDYGDLMVEYMSTFPVPLDLRAFQLSPPTATHVSVRGVKPSTFVSTSTGITYRIERGETYHMPCEEAERLIQQGIVREISHTA